MFLLLLFLTAVSSVHTCVERHKCKMTILYSKLNLEILGSNHVEGSNTATSQAMADLKDTLAKVSFMFNFAISKSS